MNHEQLKADNAQYLWHPMAHPGAMKKSTPDIIAKGEGCWIWDVDGHKMLDGVGGLWACNLGHSVHFARGLPDDLRISLEWSVGRQHVVVRGYDADHRPACAEDLRLLDNGATSRSVCDVSFVQAGARVGFGTA